MNKGETLDWLRLDNAGKIFPSTSGKRNTSVFRFSCELYETVVPEKLQEALDITVNEFPHFLSVLRAGVFWHYLEISSFKPVVHEENREICSPIFNKYEFGLLFDVSYYKKRINFDVYHALADGTGALHFLKTLMHHYLVLTHEELKELPHLKPSYNAPYSSRLEDGFRKYYTKDVRKRSLKPHRAYKIKGEKTAPGTYVCIEGIMDCEEVRKRAKEYDASVTVFLTALLIKAIDKERAKSKEEEDIVVTVPVDLRKYFPSETARNFFGNIRVSYNVAKHGRELCDVINAIKAGFKEELNEEKLGKRLSRLMAFENHKILRMIPLFMKNAILKAARKISDQEETTVISNVGRIELPEELAPYIKLANVFVGTSGIQLCVCTCGNVLDTTFSSVFVEKDIQRNFYRSLTDSGIKVQIRSNLTED
ncbi:MAG: acyltransferase [Anaerovoracaceae bacterium]